MKVPNDMKNGRVHKSNGYGKFKISKYINNETVHVTFKETGYKLTCSSSNIRAGSVKDKMMPHAYGVGYIGEGKRTARVCGTLTKSHQTWFGILARCYCHKTQKKLPSYIGCSVDPVWHNFQNFAEWFDKNHIEGYHLDKDIKVKGNKVYGPDTCMFVTGKENLIEAHAKNYTFVSPCGNVHHIYNLNKFCIENTLCASTMCKVNLGKKNHHHGWTKYTGSN